MPTSKRILLISYYFAPHNRIGAVRPTKLAKYLTRMGHDVTVICGTGFDGVEDPTLRRDLTELKDVHVIREWSPLRSMLMRKAKSAPAAARPASAQPKAQPSSGGVKKMIRRCVDMAYRYLRWMAEQDFRRKAVLELDRLSGTYDAIFSCYGPVCVHQAARKAKQKGIAPKWFADFRDEFAFPFAWQKWRTKGFLRMLKKEADILSAVSSGFLEVMGFEDVGRVLSNGYDREDLPAACEKEKDGILRFVYCGQLNMGRKGVPDRDVTPLFRALRKLADEGVISPEEIRMVYAGGEGALMRRYAASCGMEECIEDHGWVSRAESIRLQRTSDVLLMASWNTEALRGILTGKLFEYMMMNKPIVNCMGGELGNSGVKQVLFETGLGISCEQADGQAGEDALLDYLRTLIVRWRTGENLLGDMNADAVEAYSYPQLASKLSEWI